MHGRARNCNARRPCTFCEDLERESGERLARKRGEKGRTSYFPLPAGGPKVAWDLALLCVEELATQHEEGFDLAVNVCCCGCEFLGERFETLGQLFMVSLGMLSRSRLRCTFANLE